MKTEISQMNLTITMHGDSMTPAFNDGDALFLTIWNENFIDYGCCYLIITKSGYRMLRRIRKGSDNNHVLLVSDNERFDSFEFPLSEIDKLFIVSGSISRKSM